MTPAETTRVLVTGATGRVGRIVVDRLLEAGVTVRALTRHPATTTLPAAVEVVSGDLTVPESLDLALHDVSAVFLVWTAPPTTMPAVVDRLARQVRRVVFGATIGHPALITSTVSDLLGSPPRTFRQWADDHAGAFL